MAVNAVVAVLVVVAVVVVALFSLESTDFTISLSLSLSLPRHQVDYTVNRASVNCLEIRWTGRARATVWRASLGGLWA